MSFEIHLQGFWNANFVQNLAYQITKFFFDDFAMSTGLFQLRQLNESSDSLEKKMYPSKCLVGLARKKGKEGGRRRSTISSLLTSFVKRMKLLLN